MGEISSEENRIRPFILHQFKKPKDGKDFTWQPVHEDEWKPKRRTGWMRVSTDPEPPTMDELPPVDPHGEERDLQIPLPKPLESGK